MDCSIIICTRDRAPMLQRTLEAFENVIVPRGMRVEMVVVDNGSVDNTAEVVRFSKHHSIEVRYVLESLAGHSRALNTGIREAASDVLLFTDDDVEPAADWIEKMTYFLLKGRCEAVAGRILLSDELQRSWMTPMHMVWLAIEPEPRIDSPILIGACMGLHRSVFGEIDHFDESLGPGAMGYGADTMIWKQIKKAGLRILPVLDTYVIHHPDPSRLLRASWLAAAVKFGRTGAYFMHHWEHVSVRFPALQASIIRTKLVLRRLFHHAASPDSEGCPNWEMSYIVRIELLRQFRIEVKKPRNYPLRGLRKIVN